VFSNAVHVRSCSPVTLLYKRNGRVDELLT